MYVVNDLSGLSLAQGWAEMKQTEFPQETRKIRFEIAYEGYKSGSFTHAEVAIVLGYVIVHSAL